MEKMKTMEIERRRREDEEVKEVVDIFFADKGNKKGLFEMLEERKKDKEKEKRRERDKGGTSLCKETEGEK